MTKNSTLADFKDAFRRNAAVWQSLLDEGRAGTEYAALSPEEIEVFDIQLERYAPMVALYEAYEAVKNICDMGSYSADLRAAMRQELDLKDDGHMSAVEMQKLGQVVGVSYRDASAMFYKVMFWERRVGLTRFKDEPEDQPIPF